jgi:ATP-dependent helicase HrpA
MAVLDDVCVAYDELLQALPPPRRAAADVVDISWLVEELRVSLFTQRLGTPIPVSAKRVHKAITAARDAR